MSVTVCFDTVSRRLDYTWKRCWPLLVETLQEWKSACKPMSCVTCRLAGSHAKRKRIIYIFLFVSEYPVVLKVRTRSNPSALQKKHHVDTAGRPVTAPCPYCFAHLSVKSLSRHKKDMHGSQKKVHKCSMCDAKLTRLDNLRRHMMLRHRYQKTHWHHSEYGWQRLFSPQSRKPQFQCPCLMVSYAMLLCQFELYGNIYADMHAVRKQILLQGDTLKVPSFTSKYKAWIAFVPHLSENLQAQLDFHCHFTAVLAFLYKKGGK